jgi:hypothetical protein
VTTLLHDRLGAALRGEALPWGALGITSTGLLDACATLQVSTLLHHRLAGTRHDDWPDDVRRELARTAHASAAIEMIRSRETAAVLNALAAAGIHPILLKGAPLAHVLYDSPALRPHADTDLLIRAEEREIVKSTMRGHGYVESLLSDGEMLFCQFAMVRRDRFGVEHAFDFHWKISTQTVFAGVLMYEELAAAAIPVPALGPHARCAGAIHALLLACIHPVMHHRGTERLIWLYDIHLLMSRFSDVEMERFANLAVDKRVAAICLHQLKVTRERFGTSVPDRVSARLLVRGTLEPSEIYLRPSRRWHHELASNVRGLPRFRDRIRLVREVLFPSPRYMLDAYRLSGYAALMLPVFYGHRLLNGVWNVMTGRK